MVDTLTPQDQDADKKYAPHPSGGHDRLAEHERPDAAQVADLEKSFAADSAPEPTYGRTPDAKQVKNGEVEAVDENSMNFTGGKDLENGKQKKRRFWTKKRAKIAGGISGVALGGGLLGFSLLSGPFEFIHLAQILHNAHFSHQEDAGDGRMGKLYKYIRKGGSAGHTRLGYLSSKYYDRIIANLNSIGIQPEYGSFDTYKGFTIDTEHEGSPYKGMTPEEAAAAFEERTGIKPSVDGKNLRVSVNSSKFFQSRKAVNAMLGELGDSKAVTAVRSRVLGQFGKVTWHPMAKIDKKVNNTGAKVASFLKDKWNKMIADGEDPVTVDASGATEEGTDENGKPTQEPASDADKSTASTVTKDPAKSSGVLKNLAEGKTGKIAGGIAAIAGVACGLKAINDHVGEIRYAQYILPITRIGMDAITVGEQVASGQDFSTDELSYLSKNFSGIDPSTNKMSSGDEATPIRAEYGQTGGYDSLKNNGMKELLTQSSISWLDWTKHLGALCSTAGQIVTGVISVAVGILSGGTASTLAGLGLGAVLTGPIISKASHLLAGDAMKNIVPGAEWGSMADYGARFGANSAALQFGGVALTNAQSAELDAQTEASLRSDYHNQSFFARAFSPYDYRSLTSRLIDSSSGVSSDITRAFSSIVGAGSAVMKLPVSLLTNNTNAQTVAYDYGFPEYGFSEADLNNPLVDDPYANSETVANILDSNGQNGTPDYIKKAMDCFGVQLTNGPDGWDVIPQKDINLYNKYDSNGCKDSSDQNWLRVRFFIFDTGIMEGFACKTLDDAQSCTNDGFGAATTTATPGGSTTNSAEAPAYCKDGSATGPQKIVCGAYLFDNYGYNAPGLRPTGSELSQFLKDIQLCVSNNYDTSKGCKYSKFQQIVDCSGMVDAAIYYATGYDMGGAATPSYPGHAHLQEISLSQAQAGDIAWWSSPDGHTEVVLSPESGGKIQTFGAHTNDVANDDQINAYTYPSGSFGLPQKVFRVVP